MYPAQQRNPNAKEQQQIQTRNPERTAIRGNWWTVDFLEKPASAAPARFNSTLKNTQFADFHSHGWIFRAVYKHDRHGNMLDDDGNIIPLNDPDKFGKAVHLKDIHLEKGMQCVDCHFQQDSHGNGNLYGETRNAVEIDCIDCHGTIEQTGHAEDLRPRCARPAARNLQIDCDTPLGDRRFYWKDGRLYPALHAGPGQGVGSGAGARHHHARQSHTTTKSRAWPRPSSATAAPGAMPAPTGEQLAHSNSSMTCYTCHTSWMPTCFGCHLAMTANQRMPMLHNEGLHDAQLDLLQLPGAARRRLHAGHRRHRHQAIASRPCAPPAPCWSARRTPNREWIYYQQQTISAEGYSGQAFSTFVPHTVRASETKTCTDCHVSAAERQQRLDGASADAGHQLR